MGMAKKDREAEARSARPPVERDALARPHEKREDAHATAAGSELMSPELTLPRTDSRRAPAGRQLSGDPPEEPGR
jgi:hypothetical protein